MNTHSLSLPAFFSALLFSGSMVLAQTPSASATQTTQAPPTSGGLSYKGVNIQFGGFLASEMVWRNNNTASDIATSFQKIPFGNSAGSGMPEFRGSERQSRFSLLVQGDANEETHLAGYYELDFLGTGPTSNSNESNSFNVRTRNVYMTADWTSGWHVLAGQNWSLATLYAKGLNPRAESVPQSIDAQYIPGFQWARQWQLRVAKDFSKNYWIALSAEEAQTLGPQGTVPAGTGATTALPAGQLMPTGVNFSINSWPDVILKLAAEPGWGHFEIYNLLRTFEARTGGATVATQTNKQSIMADSVGAGAILPVVPASVDLTLQALVGKGVGRYGTSQLADVSYDAGGSLNPLSGAQWLAQVLWHASSTLDVWAGYGQEQLSSSVNGDNSGYGDSAVADNSQCNALGGTCAALVKDVQQATLGAWWSFYKGAFGVAKLGAQYSHTNVDTFADRNGVAPSTAIDMAYTSLRYYPF